MKVLSLLIVLFIGNGAFAQSNARDTSIRTTNWKKFFSESKEFATDTGSYTEYDGYAYSLLKKPKNNNEETSGYPALDYISYGDLDGDGKEEALVFFQSGGTAGALFFTVLTKEKNGVRVLDWGEGYKVSGTITHDTLHIYQPVYVGWEPNCCPQSIRTTWYRIKNGKLSALKKTTEGIREGAESVVIYYYELLNSQQWKEAYALLGKKFRAKHPYQKWWEGYSNNISTEATVDTMQISDSTVHVKIIGTDYHLDADNTVSQFEGMWKLEWISPEKGWSLAEAQIRLVKKK